MNKNQWDDLFGITGMLKEVGSNPIDGMAGSIPFKIGDVRKTMAGIEVTCVELTDLKGYECSKWSDDKWRYNRPHDRGRCTGGSWTNPNNIIPTFPDYFKKQHFFVTEDHGVMITRDPKNWPTVYKYKDSEPVFLGQFADLETMFKFLRKKFDETHPTKFGMIQLAEMQKMIREQYKDEK